MIKWALHKAIDKFERHWNYDASYMRDMIDASPRAAWLFSRVTALGQFRRDFRSSLVRRGHYRGASRGLRPVHATRRDDGGARGCQPCSSARAARG